MNQQNQGSGSPSSAPMKRKRGRPRKEESVVQGENMPVMPGSDNVFNSNQTIGTTDDCDDEMVGKVITGVIEGTFNAGYLLNVKVADTDAYLRGLVFQPGQVAPVTAENDVAPHVKMIKRKEIPIPVMTPETEIHDSLPSSAVQRSKQPFEPELPVPMSKEQVLPTEIHSGISISLENQSASTVSPMADLSKNETCISSGSGHGSQCDKTVERDETLHELDASMQVKESSVDGRATKDSQSASEPINLVPTIENTDKVHGTGQHEPNTSTIELNQIPVTVDPESMTSVHNFVEKQASPKTELVSKVDTSNSNAINILDVDTDTIQPESMPYDQISKCATSESKFSSEACDFQETGDPQNCSIFGAVNQVDVNQPTQSIVNSVESENQIGSDIS